MTTPTGSSARSVSEDSCASVLLETLRNQSGVRRITIDPRRSELTLRYDPAVVSPERVASVAAELTELLAGARGRCERLARGEPCEECPAFVRSEAHGVRGVRWLHVGSGGLGVELEGVEAGLRELRVDTRRLQPQPARWLSLRGLLDALPVTLCGAFLVAGWTVEALGDFRALPFHVLACVAGGLPTAWSVIQSFRARNLDVDFLMLLGAAGAAVLGYWDEAAVLLFLFTLSSALESFAMGRTRRAVKSLMAMRPDEATVLREGRHERVALDEVRAGERIVIRPGERVPLDGKVEQGEADVDESALTGEAVPRAKAPGSTLLAGSINLDGSLVVEVTRPAAESTLTRIVDLVEKAHETRAPTQRVFEGFARYYIILILLAAGSTAILPPLLALGSWTDMFYRAMILLVVASPCALVISTPATLLSAIATAARRGILFKGGAVVERLGRASVVAFDKTGTLTDGTLVVESIEPLGDLPENELLALAAAAESASEHLLARGVVAEAARRGLEVREASAFRAHSGLGVEAEIEGRRVLVGNRRFLEREGIEVASGTDEPVVLSGVGKAVWVACDDRLAGRIHFADRLRPEAAAVVRRLRELGIARIVMLTGDEERAALGAAREAGIDDCRSGLLPDEKVAELERLSTASGSCVMVGDGVNDAPAMAVSDVGVAMGAAGTDVALEAADAVLMSSDLTKLAESIELSRRALRILYGNLFFASAVIMVLVTLAIAGGLALPVGVAAHEGSTLLVVLNGLRLLWWKPR